MNFFSLRVKGLASALALAAFPAVCTAEQLTPLAGSIRHPEAMFMNLTAAAALVQAPPTSRPRSPS